MSNEFYNFIAKNILHFFQTRADEMQPGERYCLKLDTQEMVAGVDDELRKLTTSNNIHNDDLKCSTIERGYFKEKYNDNQTD